MKVYERKYSEFTYPDEMERILKYLNERGRILVKESTIEDLYYRFSDYNYSASWMSVNDQLLEEFEEWLIGLEI